MSVGSPWLRHLRQVGLLVLALALSGCIGGRFVLGPAAEPVTLRFLYREDVMDPKVLLKEFEEKNPTIKVDPVGVPARGSNTIDAQLTVGNIDVFRDDRAALRYAERGQLLPLNDLLIGDWATIRSDYYKGLWEAVSLTGQQWGIPAGLDLYVMYVNKDQLDNLKLQAPPVNWTLEQFVELTTKLNHPEGTQSAPDLKLFGHCTGMDGMDAILWVYLRGGKLVDNLDKPNKAYLDDPRTVEAIQWYSSLFNFHAVAPSPDNVKSEFPRGGLNEMQIRGFCGTWLGLYGARGGRNTAYPWTIKWLMYPLPRDRTDISAGEMDAYYVTKTSKSPREALKLIRFLADRWEGAGNKLPPRRSLVATAGYAKSVGEEVGAIAKSFPDTVLMVPYKLDPELERAATALLMAIQRIVTEDLDAARVLAEAQRGLGPTLQ